MIYTTTNIVHLRPNNATFFVGKTIFIIARSCILRVE